MANGDGSSAPPMSESLGMPTGLAGVPASLTSGPTPMPAPRVGTDVQNQNAPLPQQYDPSTQQAQPHHHALAGVLSAIAGPPPPVHQIDPATGQMRTLPGKDSPGDAFRRILSGALIGMGAGAAAGAQGHPGAGILGGIGAGGSAVIGQRQAQNQQDIQNQQQQFENQQKAKLQEATIALHNAEMLNQRRNLEHQDEEAARKVQDTNQKFQDLVDSKGGERIPVVVGGKDVNGTPGNWEAMRTYFTNPDNLKATEGYHLVYNTTYDYSGLHREGNQWVDSDNKLVDLNTRASEVVAQIPNAKLNETFNVTPEEFQAITGFKPPAGAGKSIPVTMNDLAGWHAKKVAGDNAAMRISVSAGKEEGTWQLTEDKAGNPMLFNSKTGATQPAPGIQKTGTFAKTMGASQDATNYATTYLAGKDFTGPGDEALMEKFFELAKPSTGFRMSQPQIDMLRNARGWMDSAEAQARHAKQGTWFSDTQRQQIVKTMQTLAKSKGVNAGGQTGQTQQQPQGGSNFFSNFGGAPR